MSWITLDELIDNHYSINPLTASHGGTGLNDSGNGYNYLMSNGNGTWKSQAPLNELSRVSTLDDETQNYVTGMQAVVKYTDPQSIWEFDKATDKDGKKVTKIPELYILVGESFQEYNWIIIKYMDCCNLKSPSQRHACWYSLYELHPENQITDSSQSGSEEKFVFCESRILNLHNTDAPLLACRYVTLHEPYEGLTNTIHISKTRLMPLDGNNEWSDASEYADTLVPMQVFLLH